MGNNALIPQVKISECLQRAIGLLSHLKQHTPKTLNKILDQIISKTSQQKHHTHMT